MLSQSLTWELFCKLKQNIISGDAGMIVGMKVGTDFLYQRKQKIVLNGTHSPWANVEGGIPQGYILRPQSFFGLS